MRPNPLAFPGVAALLLGAAAVMLCGGCDTRTASGEVKEDRFFKEPPQAVDEAHTVRMAAEPTAFLRRQAESSIHWQPWSPELFAHAEAEQRCIFLLVVTGRFETSARLLERMDNDSDLIGELHAHYVCALADVEAHPELGLLASRLSAERRRPVAFPFMAWLSFEGNPIAWLSLRPDDIEDFGSVWENSHAMVSKIWKDSPRYVIFNSRRDNSNRTERLGLGSDEETGREAVLGNALTAATRLGALFDPASQSLDGSGGLVPVTAMNFSARAALDPGISEALRSRLTRLVEGVGRRVLRGAVHDPLDGGLFLGRRADGWELPIFAKDANSQSTAATAYVRSHALSGSDEQLAGALDLLAFSESILGEGGPGIGLYLAPLGNAPDGLGFLWSQERLRELLSPEEFEAATTVFGTSGLGNIPPESDPKRRYFRQNSLGMKRTPAEAASALGRPEDEVRELVDAARRRLLAQRRELLQRADHLFLETARVTAANALHVSALTALAQITGEEPFLDRARGIAAHLKDQHYSEDGGLMRIPSTDRHRGVAARGEDYALLLDALFTLYRNDLDPAHLHWAEALAIEVLTKLADDEAILLETPPGDRFGIFPVLSDAMVYGPSTMGTIYEPLGRLRQLGPRPALDNLLAAIRNRLGPRLLDDHPFVHTDFAAAVLAESRGCLLLLEGPRDEEVFRELHRAALAPEFDQVTIVHLDPDLPASFRLPEPGAVPRARILQDGEPRGEAATGPDLQRLLRETLGSR